MAVVIRSSEPAKPRIRSWFVSVIPSTEMSMFAGWAATMRRAVSGSSIDPLVTTPQSIPWSRQKVRSSVNPGRTKGSPPENWMR